MNYRKLFWQSLQRFLLPITGAFLFVQISLHQQDQDEEQCVDTSVRQQ